MKDNDKGMGELLDLLKIHPELISEIVFDPKSVKKLLKRKDARQLVEGVDVKEFLYAVAESGVEDGKGVCTQKTHVLCNGTTKYQLQCFRATGSGKS